MNAVLGPLIQGMDWILQNFYHLTGNYGWAIILLTLVVRVLLLPLTMYQLYHMRKMMDVKPLMDQIKARHPKDQAKQNEEMMKLYETHKVKPLAGCLPLVVQLPFFWALWSSLHSLHNTGGFFWLPNLAAPDPLHILPVLAGVTTYLQGFLTSADKTQRTTMLISGVLFGYIAWKLPSGLALYWALTTLVSVAQQYFINRKVMSPVQVARK